MQVLNKLKNKQNESLYLCYKISSIFFGSQWGSSGGKIRGSRFYGQNEEEDHDPEETQVEGILNHDNKRRKSEAEKLLIENEKFWKNFDERNKRNKTTPVWAMDEESNKFSSMTCDYAITEIGVNVFLKEGSELEEGKVYLL